MLSVYYKIYTFCYSFSHVISYPIKSFVDSDNQKKKLYHV